MVNDVINKISERNTKQSFFFVCKCLQNRKILAKSLKIIWGKNSFRKAFSAKYIVQFKQKWSCWHALTKSVFTSYGYIICHKKSLSSKKIPMDFDCRLTRLWVSNSYVFKKSNLYFFRKFRAVYLIENRLLLLLFLPSLLSHICVLKYFKDVNHFLSLYLLYISICI